MSGPFGSTAWMYNAGSDFYDFPITNSLRFEDGDSAYLSFTPSANGNRTTWTWSAWVKRGNISLDMPLWGTQASGSDIGYIRIDEPNTMNINNKDSDSTGVEGDTVSLLRDASAWYNIVVAFAGDESAQADRVKVYINSIRDTYVPRGSKSAGIGYANTAVAHALGAVGQQLDQFFDGYMAEVNFIDGTALTPSSFGEYKNDIWIPKDTAGLTFGDQGYRLQFKQVGTGTASSSTIGADTSGEGNHYTSANLVASDVVPDSPTNNFATYNSQDNPEGATLSEGNLKCTSADAAYEVVLGTIPFSSGKYYWEQNATSGNAVDSLSVATTAIDPDKRGSNTGADTNSVAYYAGNGGAGLIIWNDAVHQGSLAGWGAGDVMSVACDMDNKTIQFRKNNTLIYTASASANGNITNTWNDMIPAWSIGSGVADKGSVVNFGQDSSFAGQETAQGNADENGIGDFYYAPPSGYLALCTANLPDPVETIDPAKGGSPQDYFQTKLYTGNGQSSLDIDLDFTPNFVWIKDREGTYSHILANSVSGDDKFLASNATGAEETDNTKFRNFLTKAFRVGSHNGVNASNNDYVSWNWKAGTAFSNDASATSVGSIDSAGSVNSDLGFSIINFTGTGSALTVAHGLSQAPELIIEKSRDKNDYWLAYYAALGNTKGLIFSNGDAAYTSSTFWNNTSPTSTVWTMGDQNAVNNSGEETIAFCFHSVENYSKIGSYIGNESTDGTFIYTGFRPAFILIKKEAAGDWGIYDSKRLGYNDDNAVLYPAGNNAEENQASRRIDLLSNGFKLRTTNVTFNDDSETIYMAFAEQPFKYANAR